METSRVGWAGARPPSDGWSQKWSLPHVSYSIWRCIDVLQGRAPTLLQHFVSRQRRTKVGWRTRRVRKRVFKYRNLGAIIEGPEVPPGAGL